MRVVIIARSKRHTRIYYYLKNAFQRSGHPTIWLKYPKIKSYLGKKLATVLCDKIMSVFKPELLFFHGCDMSQELLLRAKKTMPVVMYYDDCLKGSGGSLEQVKKLGHHVDIMYLTNRGEIPQYREWGINARYITGGCDPTAHRMVTGPDPMYQSDVAFIGRPNTPERLKCMQAVAEKFDLKLWGSGWEQFGLKAQTKDVYAAEYRQICAGAKIVLGWNIDPTIDLYLSNRTWYTLGCGGFLLTAYCPSLEEILGRGKELDWFETVEECCQKIEYYLKHEEKRKKIALAGYELAHGGFSYQKMVAQIVKDVAELRAQR